MTDTSQRHSSFLEELLLSLPGNRQAHCPSSTEYRRLKETARREIEVLFKNNQGAVVFGPFGKIEFPYHPMGVFDSLNLFDLDELIIFSFYWANRHRYRRALDVGANIGLHALLLERCGYAVKAYEPDPAHFQILQRNSFLNQCDRVEIFRKAVSDGNETREFVRVLGNTTGSHLAGAKKDPYGRLERFPVEVLSVKELVAWPDLIKLDAEGEERRILLALNQEDFRNTDMLLEVENAQNADTIFRHASDLGLKLFAQKIGWEKVEKLPDVPTGWREGTVFITAKNEMPWGT